MADDSAVVELDAGEVAVTASYASVRLWPTSLKGLGLTHWRGVRVSPRSSKRRFFVADPGFRFCDQTVRLSRLYVLALYHDGSGVVSIDRLTSRDALMELVKHAYTLDTDDRDQMRLHLDRLCRYGEVLDIRRLAYPLWFDRLTAVGKAIDADLRLTR